ncbi:hypothetical protein [Acidovorax bellezanensis]|uniref:hypothetical protein n=1 Tax=Acidovorax bellezanensis TaxID=2976702 RepID=UPI0038CD1470
MAILRPHTGCSFAGIHSVEAPWRALLTGGEEVLALPVDEPTDRRGARQAVGLNKAAPHE